MTRETGIEIETKIGMVLDVDVPEKGGAIGEIPTSANMLQCYKKVDQGEKGHNRG